MEELSTKLPPLFKTLLEQSLVDVQRSRTQLKDPNELIAAIIAIRQKLNDTVHTALHRKMVMVKTLRKIGSFASLTGLVIVFLFVAWKLFFDIAPGYPMSLFWVMIISLVLVPIPLAFGAIVSHRIVKSMGGKAFKSHIKNMLLVFDLKIVRDFMDEDKKKS